MKVTINPSLNTALEVAQWTINRTGYTEPERVSVEKDGRHYSLVLVNGNPLVEVWTIEPDGEIGALLSTTEIPAGFDNVIDNS